MLAVETIAQTEKDLGINWVDWNPTPPDKNMGLWRSVWLRSTGPVEIRSPQVITHFANASLAEADLTVEAELHNASDAKVSAVLQADLEGHTIRQDVTLEAGDTRTIRFAPENFAELRVQNPELWWPHQMGAPALHTLALHLLLGGQASDSATIRYGIREITSEIDPQGHRLFRVNGKRILIRGGGWAPDMLLRESSERLKTQFDYVRDLNLNAIRLEGPMESDAFLRSRRRAGHSGHGRMDLLRLLAEMDGLEAARHRNRHRFAAFARSNACAAIPACSPGSTAATSLRPPTVERPFLAALKELDWPNPVLSSASENITPITGSTGVKMRGPYDYTPPDYWLADTSKFGGAYGFATEISPGAAVPPISSLAENAAGRDISFPTIPSGTITPAPSDSRTCAISKTR